MYNKRRRSRNNGEITFLTSIGDSKEDDYWNPSFESLLKFMTMKSDEKFYNKLNGMGYYDNNIFPEYLFFKEKFIWRDWEFFIAKPHYLFFLLKGVVTQLDGKVTVDISKIFDLQNDLIYNTRKGKMGLCFKYINMFT